MTDELKERVKALAVAAGAAFDPGFESIGPNPMWILSPSDLMRLAQAVARECQQICLAEDRLGLDDERAYNGRLMAEAIRARYGLAS